MKTTSPSPAKWLQCMCTDGRHDELDVIAEYLTEGEAVADLHTGWVPSWAHITKRTTHIEAVAA